MSGCRRRGWLSILLLAGVLLVAGLCGTALAETRAGDVYWTPGNATENGVKTDQILDFIFWLTAAVFVLTQTVYIYYLIRYRRRPGRRAHYTHGNNTLEVIWTTAPTLIFLGLAIWGDHVWFELTQTPPPAEAIRVDVVGYQFAWDVRYAGADGKLGAARADKFSMNNRFGQIEGDESGKDDFSSTELVIPLGRPVHVYLRSRDVIHSFYVPEFRLYQDAVPGRTIDWMWFKTIRPGSFQLACSQLCGSGHFNMKAGIRVVSPEEFEKWYSAKAKAKIAEIDAARRTEHVALR